MHVLVSRPLGTCGRAVGAFLEQRALRYHVVNPLATLRVREARQMGRDKRVLIDAETFFSWQLMQCEQPV